MTDAVRTPEQRFARLSGYPYPARWLALEGGDLRLVYVAEGAHENRPVLLLHGPPTWSYLWRGVIPMLIEGGCRVVAPDLIGFGRSDKLARPRDHRLERHASWLMALVEELDLRHAVIVAHGAAAGLAVRVAAAGGDRFVRAAGVCPVVAGSGDGASAPSAADGEEARASDLVALGCTGALSDATRSGYDAPFPEPEHCTGLRAQASFLAGWDDAPEVRIPILTVAGAKDVQADPDWVSQVPGPGGNRRRITIAGAGHYLPEDRGAELALALLAFMAEGA
jgi:haloalkane dehalogenase